MAKQPPIPIVSSADGSMPVKLIINFKGPDKRWSEVHWWKESPLSVVDPTMIPAATALVNSRVLMLASGCSLLSWRMSYENVFGDSYPNPGDVIKTSIIADTVEIVADAIPVYMQGGPQYRRTMYLSGIPDPVITGDGLAINQSPPFIDRLEDYFRTLTGNDPLATPPLTGQSQSNWGFCPRVAPGGDTPIVNITDRTFVTGASQFSVTVDANPGVTAGDVVSIQKVEHTSKQYPLNQLWVVSQVAAGPPIVITLQGFTPTTVVLPLLLRGGKLHKVTRQFVPYTNWALGSPDIRKRGNSSGVTKARNKKKYNIGFPG